MLDLISKLEQLQNNINKLKNIIRASTNFQRQLEELKDQQEVEYYSLCELIQAGNNDDDGGLNKEAVEYLMSIKHDN